MRPLRYSINVTLDGCCDHRAVPPHEDLHRHHTGNLAEADALLCGRVIYEMMEEAWREPAETGVLPDWMEPWMEPFARTIHAKKKYVVSSTLDRVDWNAELEPWRTRPLEGEHRYVFLDARCEKVRLEHRVVDMAVLVAIGVNEEGRREVLGVEVAHGESRATWSTLLEGLVERGLSGVRLVVPDAHAGLQDARRAHFSGVPWQRCQRHFLMNALERVPKAMESRLQRALRRVWDEAETHEQARAELGALAESLAADYPELAEWLEVEGEETLSCFHFPPAHRRRLRTTNGNERVNQELKRRSRVVRIFPNRASCLRLASALLKEWHEDWVTGRRPPKRLVWEAEQELIPLLSGRAFSIRTQDDVMQ